MRLPLLAVLLVACSTAPLAPDVTGDAVADTEAPRVDVPGAVDAPADVPAVDASDAAVPSPDVAAPDVAPDVAAPMDAPPDAPSDGGVDRLAAAYATASVEIAFRQTASRSTPPVSDITRVVAPTQCFYSSSSGEVRANIFVEAGSPATFLARLATPAFHDAGDPDSLTWNPTGTPSLVMGIRVTRGAPYRTDRMRQSFHVQFRSPELSTRAGLSGIPGVSADAAYGDLWLLGCPLEP